MNSIELAERRYAEIVSQDSRNLSHAQQAQAVNEPKLGAWLEQYVAAAVEEVWDHPQFRENVLWPRRNWHRG